MILSIVVLSYNRPRQIDRILKNLKCAETADFNLIIKDDCSPRQDEIQAIVESYLGQHKFDVIIHKNESNLGYDRNLLDAFNITDSEYVFLLSDDDFVDGKHISDLCQLLSMRQYKFYFTPYVDSGIVRRKDIHKYDLCKFHEVIYNSVLFSGLIYERRAVINLPKDELFLSNSIYSQVYLAALIIYNESAFGEAPDGLLHLGGDGENFFGKNEAATNREALRDRSGIASNLRYQRFLLAVVAKISEETNAAIENVFKDEYNRRLVSYLLRARASGLINFNALVDSIKESKIDIAWYVKPVICILFPVPAFLANSVSRYLISRFKKSG